MTGALLAVDLGFRTGLASFTREGRVAWVRSHHVRGTRAWRALVWHFLNTMPHLEAVVLEGDRNLGEPWERGSERLGVRTLHVAPEMWRARLLLARQRRSGVQAKANARTLARGLMRWSECSPPKQLSTDAAEAILIGLWGVLELGWLKAPPREFGF